MSEKEREEFDLEIFRLKMRLEVHLVLIRGLYTGLANTSPNGGQALLAKFAALRQEHQKIAIPGLKEGYSDLVAGEYQEALEEALSWIEGGLKL